MASFNRVIVIGNLTRDPELRYIPSGMAVTDIGLAVNDRRKGPNGDWIEETTFVDITLWGRTAEVVTEYCSKGTPLFVEGRLKLDSWEKEGKKHSKLKVVGEKIQLLGSRGGQGGGGGGGPSAGRGRPQPSSGPSYDEADYGAPADVGSYGGGGSSGSGGGGGAGSSDEIPF
jgi:single-strand DNA-binding protein